MAMLTFHSVAAVMACALASLAQAALESTPTVWPQPQSITTGNDTVYLDSSFKFTCNSVCPYPVPKAFARYQNLLFFAGSPSSSTPSPKLQTLTVHINEDAPLKLGVDESYTLNVDGSGATLTAPNQWGALRGLESFSQLIAWQYDRSSDSNTYSIQMLPVAIKDAPRFKWRGLLIDSSRHYLTVNAILHILDAMSYNKFNTLHWHVIDDQSWPLESVSYPNFTKGAYSPDAIYTHTDVQKIVTAATERGIRVVPEFDMPAHAAIWGVGYPDLVISCDDGQTLLDPTGPVYDVFTQLLKEFNVIFNTTDFIHIGGDEVENLKCWDESPKVQQFMKDQGLKTTVEVRDYFEKKVQAIVKNSGRSSVVWEEVFDKNYTVDPSSVVNVWLSAGESLAVAKTGRGVIHSFGWYLDQQDPAGGTHHYFWEDTWKDFYLNDPTIDVQWSSEELEYLYGGEASQWGEQVDSTNIDSRMWPRACATAERLWSAKDFRDVDAAEARLSHHRCMMARRGVGAGPIRPASDYGYCRLPENGPYHHYKRWD